MVSFSTFTKELAFILKNFGGPKYRVKYSGSLPQYIPFFLVIWNSEMDGDGKESGKQNLQRWEPMDGLKKKQMTSNKWKDSMPRILQEENLIGKHG